MNEFMHYAFFSFSLTIIILRFIHFVAYISNSSLFWEGSTKLFKGMVQVKNLSSYCANSLLFVAKQSSVRWLYPISLSIPFLMDI